MGWETYDPDPSEDRGWHRLILFALGITATVLLWTLG